MFNKDRLYGFPLTGFNLINEVNELKPSKVLDIGCGQNLFKGKIHNLYGFDPIPHNNVDEVSTIESFMCESESVDVALCLGSLQYVHRNNWVIQMKKIVNWVKPGGFIIVRLWPFLDYQGHNEVYLQHFDSNRRIYFKTFEECTQKLNLSVYKSIELEINSAYPQIERLSWWWKKNT